jgi:uncharacterized metal-binding protein
MAANTIIVACSGGSDVGEIADRAARGLARDSAGKMYCLAGIGGQVPSMVKFAQAADIVMAIDGCLQNCAARCLDNAGVKAFRHLRLADLGFAKGEIPVCEEALSRTAEEARRLLEVQ